MNARQIVDGFFRHEYGRLVALLSRRVGLEHIEAVEDAVQGALLTALEQWGRRGAPENPSAWLYRVAGNRLIDQFRRDRRLETLAEEVLGETSAEDAAAVSFERELEDDLLRMLFVCCDDRLSSESQIVFALKVLCGFDVPEIAQRLFVEKETIYKRLVRARQRLRANPDVLRDLTDREIARRTPAVRRVLYLLFSEGYLSLRAGSGIRMELCDEAIRLTLLLACHPIGGSPETHALLALMHLHRARISARQDGSGGLLLLGEQDRSAWDRESIRTGLSWLAKSAEGDTFSCYHAEAAIAAEHCLAPSLAETDWRRVVECYQLLERASPSPAARLGHAVALAEWKGPGAGLALLACDGTGDGPAGTFIHSAVLADLHYRAGHHPEAERHRREAIESAPTEAILELFQRRWAHR